MEKRYQVFISSTFEDLKEERQAILRSVLELDHMPAGMELFPATDATAWQIITDVIDSSDYYLLVIGGRYGSMDETGISFTEKEYEYAVGKKKPVIPLLHENPDNLPRGKTDTNGTAWKKLQQFRTKVEKNHTCVYWKTPEDLKSKAIIGLTAIIKRYPSAGWVRADKIPSEATISEILTLKQVISELEKKIEEQRTKAPDGTNDLMQGNDLFNISFSFIARKTISDYPYHEDTSYIAKLSLTWNDIFAAIAPGLINEESEIILRRSFISYFNKCAHNVYDNSKQLKSKEMRDLSFDKSDIDTCIIQFRALGLIQESLRSRSVKDTSSYWTLTPYGDKTMTQLRALRKNNENREIVEDLIEQKL